LDWGNNHAFKRRTLAGWGQTRLEFRVTARKGKF
jgi:hypothetical protein